MRRVAALILLLPALAMAASPASITITEAPAYRVTASNGIAPAVSVVGQNPIINLLSPVTALTTVITPGQQGPAGSGSTVDSVNQGQFAAYTSLRRAVQNQPATFTDVVVNSLGIGVPSPTAVLDVATSATTLSKLTSTNQAPARAYLNHANNIGTVYQIGGVDKFLTAAYQPSGNPARFTFWNYTQGLDQFYFSESSLDTFFNGALYAPALVASGTITSPTITALQSALAGKAGLHQGATFKNVSASNAYINTTLSVKPGGVISIGNTYMNDGFVVSPYASIANYITVPNVKATAGGTLGNMSTIISHPADKINPHDVTAAQIGLINTCANRVSYDGLDGSVIFTSAGVPDNAVGKKTDVSLNTLTGDFYRKDTATAWTLKGNIKGATGANGTNGVDGANGAAATVAVGTVTALTYGSAPYVTNVGSSLAAILDFGVVTGQTGAAGSPDTQAQILAKIATPTDAAKLTVQQGATEAGTVAKVEVRDSGGNLTRYITGDGSEIVKKAGNTIYKYDTVTRSLSMYRGDGATPTFTVYSSGRTRMYGSLTL